jgi:hypothetical protein
MPDTHLQASTYDPVSESWGPYHEPTDVELIEALEARGYTVEKRRTTAPRAKGSETSRMAALAIEPKLGSLRREVLDTIRTAGWNGLTSEEVEDILEKRHQTVSARILELRKGRWLIPHGRRTNRSGRQANVWVAAPEGNPFSPIQCWEAEGNAQG